MEVLNFKTNRSQKQKLSMFYNIKKIKIKKSNLYATSLLSHFFTDEEVREGLVESKEQSKKGGLEQEKYT